MERPSRPNHDQAPAPFGWRPTVLVLDDEWATLEAIRVELDDEFEVTTASRVSQAQELMANRAFDVVLTDLRMPDMNGLELVEKLKALYPETVYILMTAFGDVKGAIDALRAGVSDYLRKPFEMPEVRHAIRRCLEQRRLRREVASLRAVGPQSPSDLITRSPVMEELLNTARTVAATDAPVLICGETGTGKELLARAIHNASPRSQHPFVAVNCAALPANLIESELFGHERGAFTGAVARKPGRVDLAEKGTLVLDEVGEMPLDMQPKLLRFLQELSFERVGGAKTLHADLRVIAATNRDLDQAVAEGKFRQDLLYRLDVITLRVPPLRGRREDIPLLAEFFLQRFAHKYRKPVQGFAPTAKDQMLSHPWPGNVRELEHTVERAVILCRSTQVRRLDIARRGAQDPSPAQPAVWSPAEEPSLEQDLDLPLDTYLARQERAYLIALLKAHKGSIQHSARAAGVNPKTLYLKMTRHGLSKMDFRATGKAAGAAKPPGPREGGPGVS